MTAFVFSDGMGGSVTVFLFGLLVGSFLNVCIYRLPLNHPVVFGCSRCPVCLKALRVLDLIPVISYLFRRGRCRYCKSFISIRYPLVEILSGCLFLLCYVKYQFSAMFLTAIVLTSFLIVIAFIDIDCCLIFDKALIWMAFGGVTLNFWTGHGDWADFLIAALAGSGFLFLIYWITGGMMGQGDAKFAFAIGLWLGTELTFLALLLAFLLGAGIGLILFILKQKRMGEPIPFGPFIAFGTFFSFIYGQKVIDWWYLIHYRW